MRRFWDKVSKTETCWNWTGKLSSGYGRIQHGKKLYLAHRFSWLLAYGKLPEKLVLHTCNNRRCVNPDHLYDGTYKENTRDMYLAGNAYNARGEKVNTAKLTEQHVLEINKKYKKGEIGYKKLAKEYGVSHKTIQRIILKESWKHLLDVSQSG